jgi:RNA polymerase sigma factor (sigma-70 family)
MIGPHTTRISLMARLGGAAPDAAAWDEFIRLYAPHVIHWCHGHGLKEWDAQDVSQDVLLRFWKQAGSFRYDPAKTLRGYLRRMVLTAVSDWSEHVRRAGTLAPAGPLEALLHDLPARDDLATRIERAYDTELAALAMREVESRVEPHTWEAFRLLAIEGRSGAEVAERLGMQVNTTYVARAKVQRMIREAVTRLDTPPAPVGGQPQAAAPLADSPEPRR